MVQPRSNPASSAILLTSKAAKNPRASSASATTDSARCPLHSPVRGTSPTFLERSFVLLRRNPASLHGLARVAPERCAGSVGGTVPSSWIRHRLARPLARFRSCPGVATTSRPHENGRRPQMMQRDTKLKPVLGRRFDYKASWLDSVSLPLQGRGRRFEPVNAHGNRMKSGSLQPVSCALRLSAHRNAPVAFTCRGR